MALFSGLARYRYCLQQDIAIELASRSPGHGYLLMDALNGIGIVYAVMKTTGTVADFPKPLSSLDAFATPFEIDVHQTDIGRILDRLQEGSCPLPLRSQLVKELMLPCQQLDPWQTGVHLRQSARGVALANVGHGPPFRPILKIQ